MIALEEKSLTELRGIVQSLGLRLDWGWDKVTLIKKIHIRAANVMYAPDKSDDPNDDFPTYTRPPARNLKQSDVLKALERYQERGLIVTFPTPDTIQLTHQILRQDTTTLRAPLKDIINCAKVVLSG